MRVRIIWAVVLLIGIWQAYNTTIYAQLPIIIPAIILLMLVKETKQLNILKVKTKTILATCGIDALTIAFGYGIMHLSSVMLMKTANAIQMPDKTNLMTDTTTQAASTIGTAYNTMILIPIITAILLFALVTLTRYLNWTIITKQDQNKKTLWGYVKLQALWSLITGPMLVLAFVGVKTTGTTIPIILALIMLHIAPHISIAYMNKKTIIGGLTGATTATKIKNYLAPYSVALLVFVLLNKILEQAYLIPAYTIILTLTMLLYIAWLRAFIYNIAHKE